MLTGLRLGPGPRVRKRQCREFPDLTIIQNHFAELSCSPDGARCDISWQTDSKQYTLTVSYSQITLVADWKLYLDTTINRSKLIWEHQSNDATLIYNLVLAEIKQEKRLIQTERRLTCVHGDLSSPEARSSAYVTAPPVIITSTCAPVARDTLPVVESIVDSIDLEGSKQLLQKFLCTDLGIFSHPAFLFLLEQEYYKAVESHSAVSVIVFEIKRVGSSNFAIAPTWQSGALNECLAGIKRMKRKTDLLAEYGKNQFAIVLPETKSYGGRVLAEKIQEAFTRGELMPGINPALFKMTFGVATLQDQPRTLPDILRAAEQSLHRAQEAKHTPIVCEDTILDTTTLWNQSSSSQVNQNQSTLMKTIDFQGLQQLMPHLLHMDYGMHTYPAFLLALEQEVHRSVRHRQELFVLQLKIRSPYEAPNAERPQFSAAIPAEALKRIVSTKRTGDVLAPYRNGTFVMLRRDASPSGLQGFAGELADSLHQDPSLGHQIRSNSMQLFARICAVRRSQVSPSLLGLVSVH